jgi:endonuclease/exonuclease/phosphatase family metal-dependent hydrolase
MKAFIALLSLIILLFVIGCEDEDPSLKPLSLATFNIEWLGDSINDRVDRDQQDYENIADVIKTADLDVVALQEIENKDAMNLLLSYLPKYRYYIGKNGNQQNLAVLYKDNIDIRFIGEYMPLAIEKGRHRPGLVIEGKKGNFDWIMMVVHFKASSRWDNTPEKKANSYDVRRKQAKIANRWADSILAIGKENDIFLVGDFNDIPKRKKDNTIESLIENKNLIFLTKNLKSCKYKGLYAIDHIVCSKSAMKRFQHNSENIINLYYMFDDDIADKISDHCPIMTLFEVKSPDND